MAGKILIVDDEPNIVVSLEYLLQREGYEIAVANDGEEALARLAAFGPDLVLLDVMLPKKSGFEVCQAIRLNPDWAAIRIIMLSAKGRDIEVQKGLALGADDYLTKPFATRDLVARIAQLLANPR